MKKIIALVAALCMLLVSVSAMGDTLTMGTNAFFPPYEYYEGNEIVGIDAEIAAAIAEKLGMDLVIENMEFGAIITAITTGKVDIGMAGMTVTEDRLQSVNFSSTYATGVQAIIVKEDSEIADVDGLAGHTIGVQESTTGDIYCSDEFGDESVAKFKTGNDAVIALVTDKVDCVVIDIEPAKAYVAANEGLKVLDTPYAEEEYAIAMALDNTELLEKVNAALDELIADGTVAGILAKYISAD